MPGTLRTKPIKKADQFYVPDDLKLQMTLISMADRINERVKMHIDKVYGDPKIHTLYNAIRTSGAYQHGSKDKSLRTIVMFPDAYVYEFCDTVMTALYDRDWLKNEKALKHELIRPWWVVERM